jgi:hypothetical protein
LKGETRESKGDEQDSKKMSRIEGKTSQGGDELNPREGLIATKEDESN